VHGEIFDTHEQAARDALIEALQTRDSTHLESCHAMEQNLLRMSQVFSSYPSILDQRSLGTEFHSMDTLIEVLYRDGADHTVLLPTKVIVGRSFMVAKFNYFGFLLYLCDHYRCLAHHRKELQRVWEYAVFALLVEDVYQLIIERSDRHDPRVRRQAAIDLIHMWEYRFDRNVNRYAMVVVDLWRARKQIAPVFGTMLGTMELFTLSSVLPERWYQFLTEQSRYHEVTRSLEEFLFGLVYEEIERIRRLMAERKLTSVGRDELERMLGPEGNPQEIHSTDPREMYRFFQRRRENLKHRPRSANGDTTEHTGPGVILEEILLAYLIEQDLDEGSC
jgi:hypothetical protein